VTADLKGQNTINFTHQNSLRDKLPYLFILRCYLKALEIARSVVDALEEKKGEDIVLLDLQGVVTFTDYFVICSGTSRPMLNALMNAALDKVRIDYKLKTKVEGKSDDGWLLADFGDTIIHIFSEDQRAYYDLEELWSNAKLVVRIQ